MKRRTTRVLCSGARKARATAGSTTKTDLVLSVDDDKQLKFDLRGFVYRYGPIPDRAKDLAEIATYVFAADRRVSRGKKSALQYDAWARSFEFHIRVRDIEFWQSRQVQEALTELLLFITGDRSLSFVFLPGRSEDPVHLFDREEFVDPPVKKFHVMLFSGGLDSLAGAVERLSTTSEHVCLVSHESGQTSTKKTQTGLIRALEDRFPGRVQSYACKVSLTGERAQEETQRTRTFLYGSIAYIVAASLNQRAINFYENGVTSLNFSRREDAINARTSRTTNPKTLHLLSKFLSLVSGEPFQVNNHFRFHTKAKVVQTLVDHEAGGLIASSVTCSSTPMEHADATHCGVCFQCADRRFAMRAINDPDDDPPILYAKDFVSEAISEPESRTAVIDYLRQGLEYGRLTLDGLWRRYGTELLDATEHEDDQDSIVESIWRLLRDHGASTNKAISGFLSVRDHSRSPVDGSLIHILSTQSYLTPDSKALALRIAALLRSSIPLTFAHNLPIDENDFNDKVHGLISTASSSYQREFPTTTFAGVRAIPDHEFKNHGLLIESKYPRNKKALSKLTDEIAADVTKYTGCALILFVVYDPERIVKDDETFIRDFELHKHVMIQIIR